MIIKSESERKYETDILVSDPDAELREQINERPNGEYATCICKQCRRYLTSLDGNVAMAEISNGCKGCVDIDKYNEMEDLLNEINTIYSDWNAGSAQFSYLEQAIRKIRKVVDK